jgi:hypothetical protein
MTEAREQAGDYRQNQSTKKQNGDVFNAAVLSCRSKSLTLALLHVKTVEGHHLAPRIDKILHELLVCVVCCIELCDGAKLRI